MNTQGEEFESLLLKLKIGKCSTGDTANLKIFCGGGVFCWKRENDCGLMIWDRWTIFPKQIKSATTEPK